MLILPRVLKNFTAFIDGRGYIGRIESAKLPELAINTEDFRGGGLDAPIENDMGMNKLEGEIVLAEYNADAVKLWGLFNANVPIVMRGAVQRQGEQTATPVVIRMIGGFKTISRDDWETGKNSKMTLAYSATSYQEVIANETVIDIDLLNSKRIIGGVDQLESIRAALGE